MTSKLLLVCFVALAVGIAFAQVRTLEYHPGRDAHQINTFEYPLDREISRVLPIRKARQVADSPPTAEYYPDSPIQPQPLAPGQTVEDPNQVPNNNPDLPNEPQPGMPVYRYDTIDANQDGSNPPMNPNAPDHPHLLQPDVSVGHTSGY